jgi:dTDP-glucose 4,6-dehydratase
MSTLLRHDLDRCLERTRPMWEELRGQRIFITGATGFFGCWLLETLLDANRKLDLRARVTILTRDAEGFGRRAPHLAHDPALEIVRGDVRGVGFARCGFPAHSFSHIIHAATESSAKLNRDEPARMFETIVEGTRRTLELAAACDCRNFLFLSSGAVYGTQSAEVSQVSEDSSHGPDPLNPANAYAEGKRAAELLCALAARDGLRPKIARCFAFVGPYMKLDAHFAIGNFIGDQLAGHPIRIQGDGRPLRSYMYAADLMVWLWTILFRGTPLRAYNVGSEETVSIRQLAETVSGALEPRVAVEVLGAPTFGPPPQYVPSTARARAELGLACEVPLDEAIRRTARWFAAEPSAERAG